MSKKFKTAFIIVLVIQLVIPFTSLFKYTKHTVEKTENAETVKLPVEDVSFDYYMYVDSISDISSDGNDFGVAFRSYALDSLYYEEGKYIVFNKGQDGFYTSAVVNDVGDTDCYLIKENVYDALKGCVFKSDVAAKYGEALDLTLYSSIAEEYNIKDGKVSGPPTKAYVELQVYKGEVEILNIYINNIPVNDYIEKVVSGEIDASRYDIFKQ